MEIRADGALLEQSDVALEKPAGVAQRRHALAALARRKDDVLHGCAEVEPEVHGLRDLRRDLEMDEIVVDGYEALLARLWLRLGCLQLELLRRRPCLWQPRGPVARLVSV